MSKVKKICAANWKMNLGVGQAHSYFRDFLSCGVGSSASVNFFVPAALTFVAQHYLQGTEFRYGFQNFYAAKEGAFTGENSPELLKQFGGTEVLIGHSERRTLFQESDESVAKKIKFALDLDLNVMACVGETLQERESGNTWKVVENQLNFLIKGAGVEVSPNRMSIAYEPVWAIGTGRVATPEMAEEVHAQIRGKLRSELGDTGSAIPLLYGGSVKLDNAKGLLKMPSIDGFLVGGASLDPKTFHGLWKEMEALDPIL